MASWKTGLVIALAVGLGLSLGLHMGKPQAARANSAEEAKAAPHRYSVVETEGHNLIVTDNQTNTLYFYTIDKDEKIGSELKLRGSIDLNQVGKPGITPKRANP